MPPVLIVFQLNTTNTGGVAKDADYLPLTEEKSGQTGAAGDGAASGKTL